ncbi:MAG: hypothetical protein ACJ79K_07690 [Gemmatimonadaceae bacterium]
MKPSLAALLFWISVVVCTIAELAIVAATSRASRRSAAANAAAPLDVPRVDGARPLPRPRRWLELFYVAAPAIALAVLFVFTWRAMHLASAGSHPQSSADTSAVAVVSAR